MTDTVDRGIDRRAVLRRAALMGAGGTVGAGLTELVDVSKRRTFLEERSYDATAPDGVPGFGVSALTVHWGVVTNRRLVALTFDDGPRPQWTPMVLDTLDRYHVPATFFVVGRRLRAHRALVAGRLDRHELGNHTWDHLDLAQRRPGEAYDDLMRTHEAVLDITGRTVGLLRPPYGHLGGAALLAAAQLGYRIVLWSRRMVESRFPNDPVRHARYIVRQTEPGTILLAHDTGDPMRLVALRGLPNIITGLRERGYQFVTVSELLTEPAVPPSGPLAAGPDHRDRTARPARSAAV